MLYLELLDFPYQDFQHADLPLVPDDKLLEYGHRITQGHPLSDDVISFAIVKVLYNARANDSDAPWMDGQLSRYIPGGDAHEWRIPAEVERRLHEELGLQVQQPVEFEHFDRYLNFKTTLKDIINVMPPEFQLICQKVP